MPDVTFYDDLVALAEKIERESGLIFDLIDLEKIGRALRPERAGVTPGGMPWRSRA